ncbi:hypoxia inducible factor prolyl hydroxylase, putative [Babesia ovata]|uniref:Hypoxia inducible factor prolyl hydroxylase, putative n=1 Tax=Babesia ovata TaxID=189622 RepID=A0A2H6KGN6_9APIC|nr:hypoxia inducible factor prolyl hydroxylase, putative [Babesia ovata]GBE62155.1 hypoxia inducible factor prolyl hydroxylase, putative [Babesia ovata]
MTRQWTQEEISKFLSYARGSFDASDRLALDKKLRSAAEDTVTQQRCPSDIKQGFKKHEGGVVRFYTQHCADDVIGECVDELWSSDEKLAVVVADALENAASTYERVKQKGLNEGLKVTKEVDVQLIQTAWKQAFTKSLSKFAILGLQKRCASRATDGGLCALSEADYMDFAGDTIHSIVNEGVGIVTGYAAVDVSLRKL